MKKIVRLSESDLHRVIKESVKRVINEAYLYTKDINPKDLRISGYWTQDGYAQWEANLDNGWYSFRGTYDGVECELDEIVQGHSGYGHPIEIDDEAIEWFNQNLADKVKAWIETYAENQTYNESKLRRVIKESVKRILKETYNPFDDDDFEDWERRNVSPVSDDEYDEIMRMNPMENSSDIFNKIGFNKWNGFVSRWSKENPEEYERFMQSQMAF